MDNKNKVRNLLVVGGTTLLSRVLGLGRDVLIYAALGTTVYNSAFILAFTVPNLFRRLFGEGALTSALIPVLAETGERKGDGAAQAVFHQVVSRLLVGLGMLTVGLVAVLAWIGGMAELDDRWQLGAVYGAKLMPYMLIVCAAAVMGAALNLLGRFAAASLSPVWLNLCMIGALGVPLWWLDLPLEQRVNWLCVGVIAGGLVQIAFLMIGLRRQGWQVRWDAGRSEELGMIGGLLVPGLSAASILQVNILLTRVFANSIDDGAVSVLYLASRLMELPLGLFAIAVATVFFPVMARAIAAGDREQLGGAFFQGLRWILLMTLPSAAGLWVYRLEIVDTLFRYGVFDVGALERAAPIVGIYATSIPAYAGVSYATRALHAQKDMRGPMYISGMNLLLNAVFCLIGLLWAGLPGLATGNVAAAWVQCLILIYRTVRQTGGGMVLPQGFVRGVAKVAAASVVMALVCGALAAGVDGYFEEKKVSSVVTVLAGIPVGVGVFFLVLLAMGQEDLRLALRKLRGRTA